MQEQEEPKYKKVVEGVDQLSLGISMVVAIILGVGIGIGLRSLFEQEWLFWLGLFWGVAAAFLNVQKAYKKQKRELDELANDPKYQYRNHTEENTDK
jgi:F0F1-type ATP synthase assembly protein I